MDDIHQLNSRFATARDALNSILDLIDTTGNFGAIHRPTEQGAVSLFVYHNQRTATLSHAFSVPNHRPVTTTFHPAERFKQGVELVKQVLNQDGTIFCETRRKGYCSTHNVGRIVEECYSMGMMWVLPSHVKEAQRQLTDE